LVQVTAWPLVVLAGPPAASAALFVTPHQETAGMVAIHLPQESPSAWPLAAPSPRPSSQPDAPSRVERRVGPDRATRYRRRRLAVLVLATSALAGGVGAVGYISSLVGPDGAPVPIDARPAAEPAGPAAADGGVYVVQPGDTYWSIAEAMAPDEDPRPVVDRLREATGDDVLQAGERLVLDAG
jgi:hypothetical protein